MRAFYLEYKLVPPAVAQLNEVEHLGILARIPWSHNIILMEKLDSFDDRIWYANKTLEHGWSRDTLATWIDSKLHQREGILLCKTRKKVVAEYAFRDIKKPMGVVEYETMLTKALPEELKSSLPTVKEIEEELRKETS